ncbi:thiamin phosphate synthase [Klebsiella pneumoniae]|uniref:Thiamin phosphate synthase n=1 Tax=Klebsiella pneumoniae TaxID=573 RepID=A0A377XIW1_KLEPN|nr:thiamin phosphate synthase [Klebsiella pneumoniae]
MWYQQTLTLGPKIRGFHLVTDEILGQIRGLSGVKVGLLHLLLQHTFSFPDAQRKLRSHRPL